MGSGNVALLGQVFQVYRYPAREVPTIAFIGAIRRPVLRIGQVELRTS